MASIERLQKIKNDTNKDLFAELVLFLKMFDFNRLLSSN